MCACEGSQRGQPARAGAFAVGGGKLGPHVQVYGSLIGQSRSLHAWMGGGMDGEIGGIVGEIGRIDLPSCWGCNLLFSPSYYCCNPLLVQVYKTNKKGYEDTAREWTRKYAMGDA
eukprot:359687-Chlamydomonas_euryale.AAC.5